MRCIGLRKCVIVDLFFFTACISKNLKYVDRRRGSKSVLGNEKEDSSNTTILKHYGIMVKRKHVVKDAVCGLEIVLGHLIKLIKAHPLRNTARTLHAA